MSILKEFKKFAIGGNVMDMAVGIIIGTAFGKIVSSLVSDIIMPPLGVLMGGIDFSKLAITLKQTSDSKSAITLNYGLFLNAIIDFVIIAFSIFIAVKQINKLKNKLEPKIDKVVVVEEKPKEPTEDIVLLREIRDSLKKDNQ